MSAYMIFDVKSVNRGEAMEEYREKAVEMIPRFGGKIIVASNDVDAREGDWEPDRILIIEFPSIDDARALYESSEYQEILPIRLKANQDKMVIVEGMG